MDKVSVPKRTTTDEEIRLDAAARPERAYSEAIEAARRIAAEEYRRDVRRMMDAGTLDEL